MSGKRIATLVAFVAIAAIALFADLDRTRVGSLAASLESDGSTNNRRFVVARSAGTLHRGDLIEIVDASALAAFDLHALRPGTTISMRRISPKPVVVLEDPVVAAPTTATLPLIVTIEIAFLALAALIAIRGRSSGSLSLAWFFALAVLGFNPIGSDVPRPIVLVFALTSSVLFFTAIWCAIDFATRFAGEPQAAWARTFRRVAAPCIAIACVADLATSYSVFLTPQTPAFAAIALDAAFIVAALAFVAALALAYAHAPRGERRRVVWVSLSLAVGIGGFALAVVCSVVDSARPFLAFPLLLVLAMPIGSTYAILRYRLLDTGFVVNRATVFGATSLVVLASLALVDFGLQALLGSWIVRTGLYVQLALALGIGMATRPIHARVDRVVDDVFFRERHEAERTLRAFARDVAFIDDADVVVQRTVEIVSRATKAGCDLYALSADGESYVERTSTVAPSISRNDAAIVRIRATRSPVDLMTLSTAIAGDVAFPMFARDRLIGFIVCVANAESTGYAPDEREALAAVAHAVGLAFDTLRIGELEREVLRLRNPSAASRTLV